MADPDQEAEDQQISCDNMPQAYEMRVQAMPKHSKSASSDLESRKAGLHQQLDEILERKEQVIADRSLSEQEKSEGLVNLDQEVWQVADQLKVLD